MLPAETEGGRHQLLRTLPEERLNEVAELIRSGTKIAPIAKTIQTVWKLLPDEKPTTVEKALARFRDDLAATTVMKKLISTGAIDDVTKLAQKVDVMNEMQQLYALQKLRISKLFEREEMLPMLMDQLGKEITRGNQMLAAIATQQFDMGLVHRAPKVSNLKQMADGSYQLTENSEDLKVIEAVREAVNAWSF